MTQNIEHKGSCHCGAVKFTVDAPNELSVLRCNCSLCSMVGFVHLIVKKDDFHLLQGKDNLSLYTFNTGVAQHLFCKTCGVKSFYVPRSHPDGYSVNFNCLDQTLIQKVIYNDFDGQKWEDNIKGIS